MAKPKLQPGQAVEAEETAAVAAVATPAAGPVAEVAEPELDDNEEVEPASEDELTGDAEIVEAAGPGLAEYMAAFGDAEGARMFRDGVAFDQAQQQSLHELRGTVQDLKAELAQLREQAQLLASVSPDEAEGVNIASQPQRSSWADACRGKKN